MMAEKEKVTLKEEQETMLITLFAKASAPDHLFLDSKAREIIGLIDYDFKRLRVPYKTILMMSMRALQFDQYVQAFIDAHPNALVLHLGCGLDSRSQRVSRRNADWYDLDMPDVIALRRKFYEETPTYHMLASPAEDMHWLAEIPASGRPVLIVAEGLMMYLREEDVKRLLLTLRATFPGCHMVFDLFNTMTARLVKRNESIQQTGASSFWGIDDSRQIEQWDRGFHLREEWYFSQSELVAQCDFFYRFGFNLAKMIPAAGNAHRIAYFACD